MSRVTQHTIKQQWPRALVYFLDKNWTGAQSIREIGVTSPDIEDIMDISIIRGNTGVFNKFTITLNNYNDKYFISDDIEKSIKNLNTDSPTAQADETYKKEPYPYSSATDFINALVVNRRYTDPATLKEYILEQDNNGDWGYWDIPSEEFTEEDVYMGDAAINHFILLKDVDEEANSNLLNSSVTNGDFYFKYGGDIEHGQCLFEPMQRCIILFSRSIDDPLNNNDMIVAFTGIVSTVTDGYSENNSILTIVGEDLTKWLRLTVVNLNPAILTEGLPDSGDFLIFEHRFSNMEGWQIIKTLLLGEPDGTEQRTQSEKRVQGVGQFEYRVTDSPLVSPLSSESSGLQFKSTTAVGLYADTSAEKKLLFKDDTLHLQVFQGIQLRKDETGNFITTPYKQFFRTQANVFDNEYVKHWDIALDVAKLTNFEFYADATGDIWYHQPRFNNYHILTHQCPEAYIIRDEDIIDHDFSESDTEIVTSILATGLQDIIADNQPVLDMWNFYEDIGLLRKYGRRFMIVQHPYIRTKEDCFYYAKSLLYRINAERFTGTVTITGRVEIQPAMPCYIPSRNMIYYVKEVNHKFKFGGRFETTLQLTYGHKPWEILQEVLDYKTLAPVISADPIGQNTTYARLLMYPAPLAVIVGTADISTNVPSSIIKDEGVLITMSSLETVNSQTGGAVGSGIAMATLSGTVSETGVYRDSAVGRGISYVIITGDSENYQGLKAIYFGVVPTVKENQKVAAGEVIGSVSGLGKQTTKVFAYGVEQDDVPVSVDDIHQIKIPRQTTVESGK